MQPEHSNLAEKYRATHYIELIGQEKAIKEIESFLKQWQSIPNAPRQFPKKKAILLYGPPGTGKTSLALSSAKEHEFDLLELNSSDLRNRIKLEETLKPASQHSSLFKKGRLLLMDEIDGVTGTDIGGIPELIRIIDRTAHPLILTGNDIWASKFSKLRPKCKLVEMKSLSTEQVTNLLKRVVEKEGAKENEHFLRQIAIKSQGDIRAALNDLQAYSIEKTNDYIDLTEKRDRDENIFNILKLLFQERQDFVNLFDNTKMSLDEILLWVEENIPKEYKGEALARAYQALSNADRFRGRIYRQQFWRFLVYQNLFQSAGISYAKTHPQHRFVKYNRPTRILKIWLNNQKTAKKKTIAQKYAKHVHCSVKRTMKDFNTIKILLKNNPQIQEQLKLSGEEIDFLGK